MNKPHISAIKVASFFGLYLVTTAVSANTFTVTSPYATGPGSLPAVINQANAAPGDSTIQLAITNPIILMYPLPVITNNLRIIGRTDAPSVIDGAGTNSAFSFAVGTTSALSGLVIQNCRATLDTNQQLNGYGAAISSQGRLTVDGCFLRNCRSYGGGAINNQGSMTVQNSEISGSISSRGPGAGVLNLGSMSLLSCKIVSNLVDFIDDYNFAGIGFDNGGGVFNGGDLVVESSQLVDNLAGNGAGIYSTGSLSVVNTTFSNNVAALGFGGAIYNAGNLFMLNSTLVTNSAIGGASVSAINLYGGGGGGGGGLGGGLYLASGTANLTNCTMVWNQVAGGTGGAAGLLTWYGSGSRGGGNNGGAGGYGRQAVGGDPAHGILSQSGGIGGGGGGGGGGGLSGELAVSGRGAGGGFAAGGGGNGGDGGYAGGNGGFRSPSGNGGGGGGGGVGGAIFAETGAAELINCTITANSGRGGQGGTGSLGGTSGSPGQAIGGGVYNYNGSIHLLNTLIAGNSASNSSPDVYGTFASAGFNLIGNYQGSTGLSINDFQNVPADIGPLRDNGGRIWTCVPLSTALAIGNGTSVGGLSTDARGAPYPQNGTCDIGAVQTVTGVPMISLTVDSPAVFLSTIFDESNSYRIEASTNLVNWLMLTNVSGGGAERLLDWGSTNLPHRFYRAIKD